MGGLSRDVQSLISSVHARHAMAVQLVVAWPRGALGGEDSACCLDDGGEGMDTHPPPALCRSKSALTR